MKLTKKGYQIPLEHLSNNQVTNLSVECVPIIALGYRNLLNLNLVLSAVAQLQDGGELWSTKCHDN